MSETERRFLVRLRDADNGLARSSIGKRCLGLVDALQTCGAARFRPVSSGVVLQVDDTTAFRRFISSRYPQGIDIDPTTIADRASAVWLLADAKTVKRGTNEGVCVRSAKPETTIHSVDRREEIPVGELSSHAGGVLIRFESEIDWNFDGTIAVVENGDPFWNHECVLPDVDLAVFAPKISRRFLQWLQADGLSQSTIIHWGDYDPVGMTEYRRLAEACPGRVTTHAPDCIDELLPRFGKRTLVIKQARYLDRLRANLTDPVVARMVELFDKHRRGLEQEILLRTDPLERLTVCGTPSDLQ